MISIKDCTLLNMKLPSSCGMRVLDSDKLYRVKDHSGGNFIRNSMATNCSSSLDNNYVVDGVLCAASASTLTSNVSYVQPIGVYGRTLNDGNSMNRRTHWKNNRACSITTSDGSFKQPQEGNERTSYGFRQNSTNNFNTANSCDNLNDKSNEFINTIPSNQHNSTNGHSKNKYCPHNKKPRRYNNIYADEIHKRAYGLMERFKAKAKVFQINPSLAINVQSNYCKLDKAIWDLFVSKSQTEEAYLNKLELWHKIYIHIGKKLYMRFALFMVGSTMSGLATHNSDLDMCLLLRSVTADPRHEAVNYLEEVRNSLINCDFVKSVDLIQAKVPILKCVGVENGFAVDLNYNNSVGIRNTHLLYCYIQLDWRVRPLVIIVKLWAQANSINDAKHMTISSYSLALMVIHYLQCVTNPPILPCLHEMYPYKFKPEKEIHELELPEKLPTYQNYNKQSLGELLTGFLQYYTSFNYETNAISVRLGRTVPIQDCRFAISAKNDIHQWKYLCIEEPFDFTNTARSVYDLETFRRIRRVFQESSAILLETKDLNCLLNIEGGQR